MRSAAVTLIGIDCSSDPKKCGIAIGTYSAEGESRLKIQRLKFAEGSDVAAELPLSTVAFPPEVAGKSSIPRPSFTELPDLVPQDSPVLLCLDTPLGWPEEFKTHLADHKAGKALRWSDAELFRRLTDRYVHENYGKLPLEVGASWLGRTAYWSLLALDQLRSRVGKLELLTSAKEVFEQQFSFIEVYPAATLSAYHAEQAGSDNASKLDFIGFLVDQGKLEFEGKLRATLTEKNGEHLIDAVICAVAGADFIAGRCESLDEVASSLGVDVGDLMGRVESEGWIWVRKVAE